MAKFFPLKVTREAITAIEFEDPFDNMRMFGLVGVESRGLTLEDVPQEYRPYKGCLFVSVQCSDASCVADISCAWILCSIGALIGAVCMIVCLEYSTGSRSVASFPDRMGWEQG